jgi:hypothetical protein
MRNKMLTPLEYRRRKTAQRETRANVIGWLILAAICWFGWAWTVGPLKSWP